MTRTDAGRPLLAALLTLAVLLGGFALLRSKVPTPGQPFPTSSARLAFEPAPDGKSFLVRDAKFALSVDGHGTHLSTAGSNISTRLLGARVGRVSAYDRQSLVVNRYQGDTARTGIPTFGRVAYDSVYPGIDLVYHGRGGLLEYDFNVSPGADPARIALALRGAGDVRIDARGDLVAKHFRQHKPVAYQEIGGSRHYVDARFVLSDGRVAFDLGAYDRRHPLVIDPTLVYGDYIGGAKQDSASRVAIDANGNIYIVGTTTSTSISGTSATRSGTDADAFVMKIAPDHTRQWLTYIGGTVPATVDRPPDDSGTDIGLDAQGRPYISGTTASSDFPDGDAFGLYGPQDSFTAAFATDGTKRWAGTWGIDDGAAVNPVPFTGFGNAIAVQGDGQTYTAIAGTNNQTPPNDKTAGLIVMRNASGAVIDGLAPQNLPPSPVQSPPATTPTHSLSATRSNVGGVGIPPGCQTNCSVFFAGHSDFSFTCPNPAGTVNIQAAYVAGYSFVTHTQLWGGHNLYYDDCKGALEVTALDVSHNGDPVMVGFELAPGDSSAKPHGFIARYAGSNGAFDQFPFQVSSEVSNFTTDVAHDPRDNILVVGTGSGASGDYIGAIQSVYAGGAHDGEVFELNPDGPPKATAHENATIPFSTLYGGSSDDSMNGVASGPDGTVVFVGSTASVTKLPLQGVSQEFGGQLDAFIGIIRPNHPRVADGPSGTLRSHDAKFTYTVGAESGFAFSAEDIGVRFECKLEPVEADFSSCGALLGKSYSGLADGSYTFKVRSFDGGGTPMGSDSRAFTVDTSTHASFSISPNPVLVGRPATFDGSASSAGTPITKYEWDLDGNGSFEKDTGATATVTQVYPTPGTVKIGLRVTDSEGKTASATGDLTVNSPGGVGTQFGVTINNGAQYTNDPDVIVTSTFPSFTTGLLFSNDGGFGSPTTFPAKKDTNWKLDSSGPERLPKTIYVRFLTGSITGETHQDDIILDETPPKIASVQVSPVAATSVASAARLKKFTVKTKASDKTSGVGNLQATANKKKPGKALKYKKKLVVKAAKRPKWVRVRDRAGNWSKWKKTR